MRVAFVSLFAALALAGCAGRTAQPPVQQIQAPTPVSPVKQPEVTPQYRAQVHIDLAAGYYERGRMDVALEELNEAVKIDPNNARAFNLYGLVYSTLGDTTRAEQSFQRALTLAPQDSEARHAWGWYLCTHNRARESIAEFDAALRNPLYRSPEVTLVNAGRCAASYGDVKAAENYYRRALQISPNDTGAAYGLALLAFKAARFEEARAWMRAVMLQTNPPPEALYLGLCVERRLGDRQSELSYSSQLRNRYPDAPETRAIGTGTCE